MGRAALGHSPKAALSLDWCLVICQVLIVFSSIYERFSALLPPPYATKLALRGFGFARP